jgi:hypothetical protein
MFASKGTFSPRLFNFLGIDFQKVQSEEVKNILRCFDIFLRPSIFSFYISHPLLHSSLSSTPLHLSHPLIYSFFLIYPSLYIFFTAALRRAPYWLS